MSRILEVPLLIQMIKGSVPLGQVVQKTHDLSSQRPKTQGLIRNGEQITNPLQLKVESGFLKTMWGYLIVVSTSWMKC